MRVRKSFAVKSIREEVLSPSPDVNRGYVPATFTVTSVVAHTVIIAVTIAVITVVTA